MAEPKRWRYSGGTWEVECKTSSRAGSTYSTWNDAVPGGPSGITSPTRRSRTRSAVRTPALGQLAGNSSRSTQRSVYQPPRCQPIWVSHGQTSAGSASMVTVWLVTVWLVTTVGRRISSSSAAQSALVAAYLTGPATREVVYAQVSELLPGETGWWI